MQEVFGHVTSGRGKAASQLRQSADELRRIVGDEIVEGSLNVLLTRPIKLVNELATTFADGERLLWQATLNDTPVWLYRWRHAPLHVVEILAPVHFRKSHGLKDGDKVRIKAAPSHIESIPAFSKLVWNALWYGRRGWCYTNDRYYFRTLGWGRRFGATQEGSAKGAGEMVNGALKSVVKKIPVVGPLARSLKRKIAPYTPDQYQFEREPVEGGDGGFQQIQNVLNYTKTSGSSYAARQFPAGYHTIQINGHILKGQREPAKRINLAPIDFTGKTVLDMGTNQGGMLFQVADKAKWAVGVDYDPRMINAANRIRSAAGANNLSFYVLDMEKEPLALIQDLMPEPRVDVVFLLAVCMWLSNWREVIDFAAGISKSMLFETNGTDQQQADQEAYLRTLYGKVQPLSESSEDDPSQKRRKLFYFSESY